MSLDVFAAAERAPRATALISADAQLSYAELAALTAARAAALAGAGLLADRRHAVGLVARASVESVVTFHALAAYGVPVLCVHPRLPPNERARLAERVRAQALLAPDETPFRASAEASPPPRPELDPAAPLAIVPSSGSTGAPKLVVLSRGAVAAAVAASARNLPLSEADRWLLCLPLAHVGGLSILLRCAAATSAVVAFEPGVHGLLQAAAALAACIRDAGITVVSLVPTVLDALLRLEPRFEPPRSLRAILLGGAATPAALLARAKERGVPVLTTYGLTETCSQVTTTPLGSAPRVERGIVSSGRALPGIELRVDASERIGVRGPTLCSGLYDAPSPVSADGWLTTEDRGWLASDGELFVSGRVSDVIISGGENVDPLRVEAALLEQRGVLAAAVFGVSDARFGEIVACALVTDSGFEAAPCAAALATRLAPHERPRALALLAALPVLANGKLDRRAVRALAEPRLEAWRTAR